MTSSNTQGAGSSLSRQDFVKLAVGATVTATAAAARAAAPAILKRKKPNILFICNDQERNWQYQPSTLPLPNHDRLFEAGVRFANYNINISPCSPSRAVIYGGHHAQKNGMYVNSNTPPRPELPTQLPTIGHMLRAEGYHTSYKGKWHLANINEGRNFKGTPGGTFPNSRDVLEPWGFSDYQFDGEKVGLTWEGFMEDGPIAGDAAALLYNFARGYGDGKPWFLAVNFANPHDVMFFDATGRQELTRHRRNEVAPLMPAPGDPIYVKDWGFDLPESFYKDDLSTKPECHSGINREQVVFYGEMPLDDIESWRRFQNYYFNCLRDVDRHMGVVLDALKASGQADNTIVVFTGDHGERGCAHGMRQKAGTTYREEMNVPFVVVHPDLKGGQTRPQLGCTLDVVPTLLTLAGVSESGRRDKYPDLKGFDLTPVIADGAARTGRDKVGVLYNGAQRYAWGLAPDGSFLVTKRRLHRGVFDGRYKLTRYFAPSQHHIPKSVKTLFEHNDVDLYDLEKDPNELVNLARQPDAHKDLLNRLNKMSNDLIKTEIGVDDGAMYPGDTAMYNTLSV